ncbi:Cytidylyltransferase [Schizosaccharomyces pombe]
MCQKRTKHLFRELQNALCELYLSSATTNDSSLLSVVPTIVLFEYWSNIQLGSITDSWNSVYYSENAKDQILNIPAKSFQSIGPDVLNEIHNIEHLPKKDESEDSGKEINNMVSAVGGTFDHLHVGHKVLLTLTAWFGVKEVIVGVSGDELLKKKVQKEFLENIQKRKEEVSNFLHSIKEDINCRVVTIHDPFGPTITDAEIDSLIVSEETKTGATAVQEERVKRGLPELSIYCIDLLYPAQELNLKDNNSLKVSSTAIREELAKLAYKNK